MDVRLAEVWLVRLVVALVLVATAGAGCMRNTPDPLLPTVTTDNPEAEAEMRAAGERERAGDAAGAAARYRAFLEAYPEDALLPIAQLRLGKLLLAEGQSEEALTLFEAVRSHDDASVSERGAFYGAVARHLLGDHGAAIETLEPLRGRTVDPEETALLYRTLAAAAEQTGNVELAISSYDNLGAAGSSEADRSEARSRMGSLVPRASDEQIDRLYQSLPRDGIAWPMVAPRALRGAFERGELERVQAVGSEMTRAGIEIGPELRSMMLRAERSGTVDPRAVGVILPLSGRGRDIGQVALQAVMLAAGLPPRGPPNDQTPRVFFRDTEGNAERAAQAVDDLVTLHQVVAIIGPMDRVAGIAAAQRAEELGVPLLTLSPDASLVDFGENVFRFFPSAQDEARALVAAAQASGAERFAVLRPEHGYGETMSTAFAAAVEEAGGQFAGEVVYSPTATSFEEPMGSLASLRFDALFVPDVARRLTLVAPAVMAAGVSQESRERLRFLLPSVGLSQDLIRTTRRYLPGALFSQPFHVATATGDAADFAREFNARFDRSPDAFAAAAFDAYRSIRAAADANVRDGMVQRSAVRRSLATSGARETISGLGGIGPDRQPRVGTRILELGAEGLSVRD